MQSQLFIASFLDELKQAIDGISRSDIDRAVEILFKAWERESTVFLMGNGGSASTAAHFACDLAKWTAVNGKKRFRAVSLADNIPLMSALINDNGFENLFTEQLKNLFRPQDVLIGISVHGGAGRDQAGAWSQNLLRAFEYASAAGGETIGLSGFDGGPMKERTDVCLVVPIHSTLHVESLHLALEHLICSCLREKIERF